MEKDNNIISLLCINITLSADINSFHHTALKYVLKLIEKIWIKKQLYKMLMSLFVCT